ncbi:hypothetical protein UA38_15205 [Photobacterium kishitanii]|uniref:Uncharacterized protein n=1 Tax=Photobacterium kishitanii TaxID=318456 RepID=A0AAX0YW91_9GAMM|nr:hypothetical protein [Photobacterium kishitanii]KJG56367.1 hypothetical protein UA38_15205 [Photobacterium kishitanii]KJG60231.1 hypothetical protein UA42_16810 [Photobacterium kishitanii]PSX17851.1 hypothetical protein C0W70_17605 [Photobacterium kishitanii]PSX27665.1 hypothetical protein C0W52_12110 [Photobacterium kishitanii]PSX31259.1 hypothetical protein C0W39_17850 [Photobacterium kishitanii]
MTDTPRYVNELHCHTVLPHSYASKMNKTIEGVIHKFSYATKRRRIKAMQNFLSFCAEAHINIKCGTDVQMAFSAWQEFHFSGIDGQNKSASTIISDASALRSLLLQLTHKSVEGLPSVNGMPELLRLSSAVFSHIDSNKSKFLGCVNFASESTNSLTLELETDHNTFIENLVTSMRKHRDVIYRVSIQYLKDARGRHEFAQEVVAKIGRDRFESSDLQHPTQTGKGTGQQLSLFSIHLADGECGYSNLIAYLYHCHDGLIKDFTGSNNHLSRFTDMYELREHFGISTLSAVAACNIIITESGINVDSLRRLTLTAQGSMSSFFESKPNGFIIRYHKPRARKIINRSLKHQNSDDNYIKVAFDYLVDATSLHRSKLIGKPAQTLFISDSIIEHGAPSAMSDLAFKGGFLRLLKKARELITANPNWCEGVTVECINEVLAHNPSAKKIRVTEGILRWFDSGGIPAVAAEYLGNTETVAINNYLPRELQLAVYTQRVRRFQHVLIASATNGQEYQLEALDFKNETELSEYISRLDSRVPHWRTVIDRLSQDPDKKKNTLTIADKVVLDICPESVALMRACYEIHLNRFKKNTERIDNIDELSIVYQSLIAYLNENPDRQLSRCIQKGDRLYECKTNNYDEVNLNITREKIDGSN